MSLDALFAPYTLKNLSLKNRIVLAPMSRYQNKGAIPNEDFARYHAERAQDIGLSMTGATAIDIPVANNHPDLAEISARSAAGWRRVVEAVHEVGGPIALQLWHAGALHNVAPDFKPGTLQSPSGLVAPAQPAGVAMTGKEIQSCIDKFVEAAQLAMKLGFDAVELHAAHGFLVDQFFWAGTNLRDDSWGGNTLVQRSRFALEIIRALRRAIGPDTVLLMRVSQWKEQDYQVRLASSPKELENWLTPFVDAGVDILDCSQRRFWEAEFPGSDLNFAGWVKKVTGCPVITTGSVGLSNDVMTFLHGEAAQYTPLDELMRRMERGDFDLVAVGRALLADPHWANRLRDGTIEEGSTLEPAELFSWI